MGTLITRQTLVNNLIYIVVLLLGFCAFSNATSVISLPFTAVVNKSEFIFEGEVIASSSHLGKDGRSVFTDFEFRVVDVLKGQYSGVTLTLSFSGGTANGTTISIPGMRYPRLGERGIYFVKSLNKQYVHPLMGWSQGHFTLNIQNQVTNVAGQPVFGINSTAAGKSASGAVNALGIVTKPTNNNAPLSAAEFKNQIRSLVTP